MKDRELLKSETIIFTGTPKSTDVFDLVRQYGGRPKSLPLIQVNELEGETDKLRLEACATYDWLIFTSQTAVSAFAAKLERHRIEVSSIQTNIAAIGTRTAAALEELGFSVKFIPSIFSADVFVKEFKPVENDLRRLLFLRGSIAGTTIKEELPFEVDEWTVYSTVPLLDNIDELITLVKSEEKVTVLFASPSAVKIFHEKIGSVIGWAGFTIGAIGHITERALTAVGATVHVRPDTYTLKDLVDQVANRKGVTNGKSEISAQSAIKK